MIETKVMWYCKRDQNGVIIDDKKNEYYFDISIINHILNRGSLDLKRGTIILAQINKNGRVISCEIKSKNPCKKRVKVESKHGFRSETIFKKILGTYTTSSISPQQGWEENIQNVVWCSSNVMLPKISISYRLKTHPDPILDIHYPLFPKTNKILKNHLKKELIYICKSKGYHATFKKLEKEYIRSLQPNNTYTYQIKYECEDTNKIDVYTKHIYTTSQKNSELLLRGLIGSNFISYRLSNIRKDV